MARSDTRYSVYPAPKATEILGDSAPALNQAIECWASLVIRAMADNAKKFSQREAPDLFGNLDHGLHDWAFLAEALKDVRLDPDFPNPSAVLATALEDAVRLHDLGTKWFHAEHLEGKWEEYSAQCTREVETVTENVKKLDYVHSWALMLVVGWFWEHSGEIDIMINSWWSLAFRRDWRGKVKKRRKKGQS